LARHYRAQLVLAHQPLHRAQLVLAHQPLHRAAQLAHQWRAERVQPLRLGEGNHGAIALSLTRMRRGAFSSSPSATNSR
jgi:hypothetical protein